MMPSLHVLAALCAVLVLDVNSQGIIFNPNTDRRFSRFDPSPNSCDSNSYCVALQRCRSLRVLPNWSTVGVTCGYGQGSFRRVCCPIANERPIIPPTRLITPPIELLRTTSNPVSPEVPIFLRNQETSNRGCGTIPSAIGRQILNGQNATEGAWPWMVAITMRESSGIYTPYCTGFLIDRRHVLSAAHCFIRRDVNLYQARIGRVNQEEGDLYRISRIAVPAGYRRGRFYDDLAILTLDREVTTPNTNAICLPDEVVIQIDLTGRGTSVAGWGATRPNGNLSIILQQLRGMPVMSNQDCQRLYTAEVSGFRRDFPRGINNGFICAGFPDGNRDACGGDSGGPLMFQNRNRWFAVGVVSFGFLCGTSGLPGGYIRVSDHLEWIRENIRD